MYCILDKILYAAYSININDIFCIHVYTIDIYKDTMFSIVLSLNI